MHFQRDFSCKSQKKKIFKNHEISLKPSWWSFLLCIRYPQLWSSHGTLLKLVYQIQCFLYLDLILIQVLSLFSVLWSFISLLLNPNYVMSNTTSRFTRKGIPFAVIKIPLGLLPKNANPTMLLGPKQQHLPYFICKMTWDENLIFRI